MGRVLIHIEDGIATRTKLVEHPVADLCRTRNWDTKCGAANCMSGCNADENENRLGSSCVSMVDMQLGKEKRRAPIACRWWSCN